MCAELVCSDEPRQKWAVARATHVHQLTAQPLAVPAFPLLAPRNNPEELCSAKSKPQTRVFVCEGSSADALPATESSVASAQTKTPSHLSEASRRKTWSKAGTCSSLVAFFQGN
jgi:hypothetical protein